MIRKCLHPGSAVLGLGIVFLTIKCDVNSKKKKKKKSVATWHGF